MVAEKGHRFFFAEFGNATEIRDAIERFTMRFTITKPFPGQRTIHYSRAKYSKLFMRFECMTLGVLIQGKVNPRDNFGLINYGCT